MSPFDIELRAVERQLDFSDAGKAVSRFLANRNRRLFSMSTENALLTLMREGVTVQESSVDSKRDLEDALRSACNNFIEHTCTTLCKSIISWIAQCKTCDDPSTLKDQPCMNGLHVEKLIGMTADSIQDEWNQVTTQMALYLDSPATRSILLKPVSRKIGRLMEEGRQFVAQAEDGENGWTAEIRANVLEQLNDVERVVKKVSTSTSGGAKTNAPVSEAATTTTVEQSKVAK